MIVLYEYHRQSCGAQHPVIVGLAEKSALIAMNSRDDELDFGQLQRLFQMRFLMPGLDAAPSNNLAPVSIGGKARREDNPLSIDRICRTKATLLSIVHLNHKERLSAGTSPAGLLLLTAVILLLRGLHEGSITLLASASSGSAVSKSRNELVGARKKCNRIRQQSGGGRYWDLRWIPGASIPFFRERPRSKRRRQSTNTTVLRPFRITRSSRW